MWATERKTKCLEIMIFISKDMSDFINNLLFLLSEALEQGGFDSDNQQHVINTTSQP